MAGALQVRLGGENVYDGVPIAAAVIGEEFSQPSTQKAKQAIRIVAVASVLGVLASLLFRGSRR